MRTALPSSSERNTHPLDRFDLPYLIRYPDLTTEQNPLYSVLRFFCRIDLSKRRWFDEIQSNSSHEYMHNERPLQKKYPNLCRPFGTQIDRDHAAEIRGRKIGNPFQLLIPVDQVEHYAT